MKESEPMVFIVDDDESVRKALKRLITSVGMNVEIFATAREFLSRQHYERPSCLVLDVRMPGLSGLDLQQELMKANLKLPIIFITGHGTVSESVKAFKTGAMDFLEKPFEEKEFLETVSRGIEKHRQMLREEKRMKILRARLETLTDREKEIFSLVTTGMLNKQIAFDLDISEKTVKVHRARVMQKMEVQSLADLVRFAKDIDILPR